jgi:tripartite-type tricarboxylate transporter receptor subunit TctC
MHRIGKALITATALTAAVSSRASAESVKDFYQDRQVNLVLGFNPGGGFDAYARLITQYLPKYIPGHPHFVIRNMPGAGSMIAANHVFNASPRDGSEFGMFSADVAIAPLLGNPAAKFDGRKFTWIGSASTDVIYCIAWGQSPFHSIEDTFNKEMLMGAAGVEMAKVPELLNRVLPTRFKVIKGYAGTAAVKLAVERNEVQGWCNVGLESITQSNPDWLTNGTVRVLGQIGYKKEDYVPDAPFLIDYAKSDADKQVLKIIFGYPYMARPFGGPPQIPSDRAAALRNAFNDTMKDPALQAVANKAHMEMRLITGAQIDQFLGEMYATPQPIVDRAAQLYKAVGK